MPSQKTNFFAFLGSRFRRRKLLTHMAPLGVAGVTLGAVISPVEAQKIESSAIIQSEASSPQTTNTIVSYQFSVEHLIQAGQSQTYSFSIDDNYWHVMAIPVSASPELAANIEITRQWVEKYGDGHISLYYTLKNNSQFSIHFRDFRISVRYQLET